MHINHKNRERMRAIKLLFSLLFIVFTAYNCSKIDSGGGDGPSVPGSLIPEGAIDGLFTINDNGDQVYFSQGNLQYQRSSSTWRFGGSQYSFVGFSFWENTILYDPDHNAYYYGPDTLVHVGNVPGSTNIISDNTEDHHVPSELCMIDPKMWRDVFAWGTSGWPCNMYYQPWECSPYNYFGNSQGNLFGPPIPNQGLTGYYANCDWGVYNKISNGGSKNNMWRTLTKAEWDYIINIRATVSGMRYGLAEVFGVQGVLLLPDDWDVSIYSLVMMNQSHNNYEINTISLEAWSLLERHGVVFLPMMNGFYWTSTAIGSNNAYHAFGESEMGVDRGNTGYVRLVCPAQ